MKFTFLDFIRMMASVVFSAFVVWIVVMAIIMVVMWILFKMGHVGRDLPAWMWHVAVWLWRVLFVFALYCGIKIQVEEQT